MTPPPPPPDGSGLQTVTGNVTLPAGSALSLATMTVAVGGQSSAVASTGQVSAGITSDGPSMPLLLDASGNPVLIAIWDPTVASYQISSRTTAVAVIYCATNAFARAPADVSRILALITVDPAIAALDQAIATAVASDPQALPNGASSIVNALAGALQQIFPAALRANSVAPVARPPAYLQQDTPSFLLVQPTDQQDGIQVSQADTSSAAIVMNSWRRPGRVYVYRVSTFLAGVKTDLSPAVLVAGPTDLPAVDSLSLLTAISDAITHDGSAPGAPISLPAIPLPLADGTDRTQYKVVVVEGSVKIHTGTPEPDFFTDPHFSTMLADWRLAANDLFNQTMFGELLMPIVGLLGGFGVFAVTTAALSSALVAGADAYAATLAQVSFVSPRELPATLFTALKQVMSNDLAASQYRASLSKFYDDRHGQAITAMDSAEFGARISKGASTVLKALRGVADLAIGLDLADLAAILDGFFSSEIASEWDALVLQQTLNLTPQNPIAAPGDRVSFQVAKPSNAPGSTFEYQWTQTSAFATLSAVGDPNVGNAITTTQRNVDLLTTPSDNAPVNVMVVGYDTTNGQHTEIGRAATTVKFVKRAVIAPGAPVLQPNDQQTFSVTVDGTVFPATRYVWTLTGGVGSIGGGTTATTTVPQINFSAGNTGGTANLHVDVYDTGANLFAKGDASIAIVGSAFITLTIAGTWDSDKQPPDAQYAYTDGVGSRVPAPGETQYDALAFGYNVHGTNAGVAVYLIVDRGAQIHEKQTFSKVPPGATSYVPGQFILSIAKNQLDPNDPNSGDYPPAATGTLTIDRLVQLSDGRNVMFYSFSVTNPDGGIIEGNGQGQWT